MKSFISLALVAGTNAIVTRWAPCCFHLSASGAITGTVGQLDDGQNRVNGGLSSAEFCIADGAIKDTNGRGCIITPQVTQYQCDDGVPPASGFSIGSDGTLAYNGGTTFWECQTGQNGGVNIYINPGGTNCGKITLKADACYSPPSTPPPTPPPPGCPTNIDSPWGTWEFPHLLLPIDASNPSQASGTSYFGEVSPSGGISSIYNFDIPAADAGKTCSLIFLFPRQDQLTTSSFTLSGNGAVSFAQLTGIATTSTSYATAPGVQTGYGTTVLAPGNSYHIADFPCPAGTTVSYRMEAVGDTHLRYFQDWNPSPIGLYITKC
ncbi:uncharacterized protein L3040_004473 [Drepanopeziza brunnea f. sp. 'multigermtubi']|uniref:GPI anchored cell wall protein n=1 Tax=Marssonina brunnea f. sp. multigermtubi (strain MB_m1) TaxID=1072389 RepID=K1XB25_MARBU|nr:GPI anchored cell wall protein [Drepanopeziza brunnea f. sp. 'multigermtubi' MB_m1]EKD17933.1 GPI anchored cell wall protein [Drepanopeziza brunnea f. sp. 'multigermtubi' MB_m1]KAJ5043087.1 hypothetical protein L3040_004473 [Drepanopeziza brunnea f. sp. 'multigermtubi']